MSELTEFRKDKDRFMAGDPHSPLTPDQQRGFRKLSYYNEMASARSELDVEEFEVKEVVEMQTSTGDVDSYLRFGKVAFTVDGQKAELTLYKDTDRGEMSLPFSDATSGTETYGSGRYLDVHELPHGRLLLDFNYAYNPYCAYNDRWSCPLTPFENRLKVPIRAGEKTFK